MYHEEDDAMFEVHYKDADGRKHVSTYYAESKKDAQRQFNAEKEPDDVVLFIKKAN